MNGNDTNTLADLIAQAAAQLRADGRFALAAAVEQNALHNQELARHVERLAETARQATALADSWRAQYEQAAAELTGQRGLTETYCRMFHHSSESTGCHRATLARIVQTATIAADDDTTDRALLLQRVRDIAEAALQ